MNDPTTLDLPSLPAAKLRAALRGRVTLPEDPGYDERREVFNAAVDRRPAAIVRAADASDVGAAIRLAREHGLELAVLGGGHSWAGHGLSEGGLVIDTSAMRTLELDPGERTAWAGAGLTAGEYTTAAGAHGLATGFGDTGGVGVAGITLGGGIGWLARKHGLTIDDLLAVELVGADGELVRVDAESHPDLFWALRGGGGNFGVVTRLRYRLHELGEVVGGMVVLPPDPGVLESFLALAAEAPDELTTIAHLAPVPPVPFVDAEHHGRLGLTVMLVHAGTVADGERVAESIRGLAPPLADGIRRMPYPEIYELGGGGPQRSTVAVRAAYVDGLDRAAVEAIVERMSEPAAGPRVTQIRVLGGAVARVAPEATAYAHRERRLMVTFGALGERPEDLPALDRWVDASAAALGLGRAPAYVNYLVDEGDERVRAAYPDGAYERLAELKRRYDPENVFRVNQNIDPAGELRAAAGRTPADRIPVEPGPIST